MEERKKAIKREAFYENVTVDFIALSEEEYLKRLCAVWRTLLEIDETLESREIEVSTTMEAA